MNQTTVSFSAGSITEDTTIEAVHTHGENAVVILTRTPFHPVDHTWPDQPGDTGTIGNSEINGLVIDTVMVAVDDAGTLAVGADIPVKRGEPGWQWHVGHVVAGGFAGPAGITVRADVDEVRRAGLSRGHTACHLASLALDAALAGLWRKDPGLDPLGSPNFEVRANVSSQIAADSSVDTYRLGKSLRKAGFDTETFAATLAECETRINETLASWVQTGARSWIEAVGDTIADRRTWHCALPEGEASFLCGGTHVEGLDEFASITVALDLTDPQLLVMTTTVLAAAN